MPQDRFLHPRLGHSEKVTRLTDFEYRVWTQYILSADDFGVMRASAVTLQADNDALAAKKAALVQRALEQLIHIGLLRAFMHQGRTYVYQPDWQDWQHVGYPRATIQPLPPEESLAKCSEKTQKHFARHSVKVSEKISESSTPSRAREMAKTNGSVLKEEKDAPSMPSEDVGARAGRLREELYPAWYAKHRHGAKLRLVASPLEYQDALGICQTWDDDRIEKLATIFLTTDDTWISGTDRSFRLFAQKATWCDDRLTQWEASRRSA